jgi:hypothetical protein
MGRLQETLMNIWIDVLAHLPKLFFSVLPGLVPGIHGATLKFLHGCQNLIRLTRRREGVKKAKRSKSRLHCGAKQRLANPLRRRAFA